MCAQEAGTPHARPRCRLHTYIYAGPTILKGSSSDKVSRYVPTNLPASRAAYHTPPKRRHATAAGTFLSCCLARAYMHAWMHPPHHAGPNRLFSFVKCFFGHPDLPSPFPPSCGGSLHPFAVYSPPLFFTEDTTQPPRALPKYIPSPKNKTAR